MALKTSVLLQFGQAWMWWRRAETGTLNAQKHTATEAAMVRFTPPVTLKLSQGEVIAWEQAATRVRVVSGRVWITQRNDLVDHFLHHGQCFELRRGHGMLIGAEQDVWLRFERDPSWRGSLWNLWRRLTGRATQAATVAG
jgi:Protein of unknown function (DUF2917)